MKLFLASYKLVEPENQEKLKNLIGSNKKIAVIPNALDFSTELERKNASMQFEIDVMNSLGLQPELLDLKDYFGKPDELEKKMSEFGSVWVRGGNTFVLRSSYKQSGFDNWLLKHKQDKDFVYAGYSAGACILSRDFKGLELVDDPNVFPEGYPKETIWEGLHFFDFVFVPHFNDEVGSHPETEATRREVEYYVQNKREYRTFKDGDVLIMEV